MSRRVVVLASDNTGKMAEFAALLPEFDFRPQSDFGLATPPEDGASFAENALLKARFVAGETGLPTLADDSGLAIDALGGEPGIRSARYAGEEADFDANIKKVLKNVAKCGEKKLTARFYCVLAYIDPTADDNTPLVVEARWEGRIVRKPTGVRGFGYDPIFYVPEHGCTAAELPAEVKNRLSHRAQACALLKEQLRPDA